MSSRGAVAAGHPATCDAAALVLEAGGSACDAAVAAGFAASICEPTLTSLGGGGFLLARSKEGTARLFDFFSDTPGRALPAREREPHFVPITVRFPGSSQVFNVGLGSVAVPGTLAGLLHVHERLGRIPLREVLAPAVALARDGVPLGSHQAYFLELLEPIVSETETGRELFAPEGRLLREGELLRNPELADFLESLPGGGAHDLYHGSLGERLAREMHEGQGLLTAEDLCAYQVIERRPTSLRYRGHELLTNPPPSFGGSLLGLSLRLLESVDLTSQGPAAPTRELTLLRVMREVDGLRERGCLSPASFEQLSEAERTSAVGRVQSTRGTTHVSVCDPEGNAASMTTSNGEGSGHFVPGAGIHLNNMLGEDDLHPDGFHAAPPGERVASMMSPSLLLRDGELRLVLGSGGSKRIRTALLQVLSFVVDSAAGIGEAVVHPRIHWDGETCQVEPGLSARALATLRRDAPVNEWESLDVYFGGVHAVTPDGVGAGDPRRGGAVRVVGD